MLLRATAKSESEPLAAAARARGAKCAPAEQRQRRGACDRRRVPAAHCQRAAHWHRTTLHPESQAPRLRECGRSIKLHLRISLQSKATGNADSGRYGGRPWPTALVRW